MYILNEVGSSGRCDPGQRRARLQGAVGCRDRRSAERARLAGSAHFFQQAAGKRGREDTGGKVSPGAGGARGD